jgi:hypothetical protein
MAGAEDQNLALASTSAPVEAIGATAPDKARLASGLLSPCSTATAGTASCHVDGGRSNPLLTKN